MLFKLYVILYTQFCYNINYNRVIISPEQFLLYIMLVSVNVSDDL